MIQTHLQRQRLNGMQLLQEVRHYNQVHQLLTQLHWLQQPHFMYP